MVVAVLGQHKAIAIGNIGGPDPQADSYFRTDIPGIPSGTDHGPLEIDGTVRVPETVRYQVIGIVASRGAELAVLVAALILKAAIGEGEVSHAAIGRMSR